VSAICWLLVLTGCGSASEDSASRKLEPGDVRPALRNLPYRHRVWRVPPPKGDTAAFRGRAEGPHHAALEFSIGLGDPPQTSVAVRGAGKVHSVWESAFGYVYNDSGLPKNFRTDAEWRAAATMGVEIEESLCKAVSGEPCPI
jgi:hypothetical protein